MKVISWNCQGVGHSLDNPASQALVAQEMPNLVFLIETKNQEHVVERTKRKISFQYHCVVNPVGIEGGMAPLWSDSINVEVRSSNAEFIDVECKFENEQQRMRLTFVHAPVDFQARSVLWGKIHYINNSMSQPWVCMGDFNAILYH